MKALSYMLLFWSIVSVGQTSIKTIHISRLDLESKRMHHFTQGDSMVSVVIDTLIMQDGSRLNFAGKRKAKLIINYAVIGKNCVIAGNDDKNNGTNLEISANFIELESLFIRVSGESAKTSNRKYDNGDSGHVTLSYSSLGKKPQTGNKKQSNFLSINNKAGGYNVNPNNDIAIIVEQVRNGFPGRPGAGLPNGRVYSGNIGQDGLTTIKEVNSLN